MILTKYLFEQPLIRTLGTASLQTLSITPINHKQDAYATLPLTSGTWHLTPDVYLTIMPHKRKIYKLQTQEL